MGGPTEAEKVEAVVKLLAGSDIVCPDRGSDTIAELAWQIVARLDDQENNEFR